VRVLDCVSPSASFGGINAVLKWLPGYRHTYLAQLKGVAQGQPGFLHGWFHFWITLQSGSPSLWADLTGIAETVIALVLLLGVARRAGYLLGAGYMLLVWAVGEGFAARTRPVPPTSAPALSTPCCF
jgi:thiosulfate dehydrogenase (quinone) large subunit